MSEDEDPTPATTPAGSPTATQGGPLAGPPATGEPDDDATESEDDGGDQRAG